MTKLRNAIFNYNKSLEKTNPHYHALLGKVPGVIAHETRNGFCYARIADNPNEIITVFNDKVGLVFGLPIIIERKNNTWYVIGRDIERYKDWGTNATFLPNHARQHEFDKENNVGADTVHVYADQFMPALVYPSETGTSGFMVAPYILQRGADFIYTGNTGTGNLLQHKPNNSGTYVGLVYLDSNTGNPGYLLNTGTPTYINIKSLTQISPYLPYPGTTQIPLYGFTIQSGTSALGWENLYNVRQFFNRDGGLSTGSTTTAWGNITGDITNQTDLQSALSSISGSSNHAYYQYLASLLEPDALEPLQVDTFSYAVAGGVTKYLLASWQTKLGSSGRMEVRNPSTPLPLRGVTLTGLASNSAAIILDPSLPTYSNAREKYFDRLFALANSTPLYLPLTAANTTYPFLCGAYGAIITRVTNFDFTWVIGSYMNGRGFNFANEESDAAIQRNDSALNLAVDKKVICEVRTGNGTAGNLGGIVYHLLPSTWSVIADPNTYDFRDDFMGTAIDTATKWTRSVSSVGNIEIDLQYQWLKVIGDGSWGNNGMFSQASIARATNKVFMCDVFVDASASVANTNLVVGFHDGSGQSYSDFAHGIDFTADGTPVAKLTVFENGTSRGNVGNATGWEVSTIYRVRITLTAGANAIYEIQGGAYSPLGGVAWTDITPAGSSSATGTLHAGVAKTQTRTAYVSDVKIY